MKCFSLHFLQAGSLKEPEVSTSIFFIFFPPLLFTFACKNMTGRDCVFVNFNILKRLITAYDLL